MKHAYFHECHTFNSFDAERQPEQRLSNRGRNAAKCARARWGMAHASVGIKHNWFRLEASWKVGYPRIESTNPRMTLSGLCTGGTARSRQLIVTNSYYEVCHGSL